MTRAQRTAAGRRRKLLRSPWLHALLALVLVALVQGFLVKVYRIPSGSMEQTLEVGDRVLVNRTAYLFSEPQHGDVVVFRKPDSWGPGADRSPLRSATGWFGELMGIGPGNTEYVVKRVVGAPGDTVACCDARGRITVNGEGIDEPYVYRDLPWLASPTACAGVARSPRCFAPVTVGEGQYLLLGDHRAVSEDSVSGCRAAAAPDTCARTVGKAEVIGRVDGFLLPFSKWGQGTG